MDSPNRLFQTFLETDRKPFADGARRCERAPPTDCVIARITRSRFKNNILGKTASSSDGLIGESGPRGGDALTRGNPWAAPATCRFGSLRGTVAWAMKVHYCELADSHQCLLCASRNAWSVWCVLAWCLLMIQKQIPACFSPLRHDPIQARSDYNDLYSEASQTETHSFPSAPN